MVSLIVAHSTNRVIGRNGQLPWRLGTDLRRFQQITWSHTIVMGRATFESLGRLLPHRHHIVLSTNARYRPAGVHVYPSLELALREHDPSDEWFVIGGGQIFRQALPRAQRVYLTEVLAEVEGDTFFPVVDWSDWSVVEEQLVPAGPRDEFPTRFRLLERGGTRLLP